MSVISSPYLGTLVATSDDRHAPSLLMIVLVVLAVLTVVSLIGGSSPRTVVVVERPWGVLTTLFVLAGGLGLLYLLAFVPTSSF